MNNRNAVNIFVEKHWKPHIKEIETSAMTMDPHDPEDLVSDTLVSIVEELNNKPDEILARLQSGDMKTIQSRMMHLYHESNEQLLPATVVTIDSVKGARSEGDTMKKNLLCDGFSNQKNNPLSVPDAVLYFDPEVIETKVTEEKPRLFKRDSAYVLKRVDPSLDVREFGIYDYGKNIARALSVNDKGKKLYVSPQQIVEAINYASHTFTKDQLFDLFPLIVDSKTDSTKFVLATKALGYNQRDRYTTLTEILSKGASVGTNRYVQIMNSVKPS